MKAFLILIFCLLVAVNLRAQDEPLVSDPVDSLMSINTVDSLKQKVKSKLDSLYSLPGLDSVRLKIDSIGVALQTKLSALTNLSKTDSAQTAIQNKLSTLANTDRYQSKVDSLTQHYQSRADSLQSLNLPHEKYLAKMDSLGKKSREKVNETLQKVNAKAEEKFTNTKQSITDKVNENLGLDASQLTDNIPNELGLGDKLELPNTGLDLNQLATPELDVGGIENDPSKTIDINDKLNVDGLNTDKLENLQNNLNISEYQDKLKGIEDKATKVVEEVKKETRVDDLSGELEKVNELSSEVSGYSEEIAKVKSGNLEGLDERIEREALKIDELKKLNEESAALAKMKAEQEKYKGMQEKYLKIGKEYSDPEFVKQRILEKSKYVANELLVKYSDKVAEAQAGLSKLKLPIDSLKQLKEAAKKLFKSQPVKDKIVAGFNLEVLRNERSALFDLAPLLGIKLNNRLTIYGSYVYRFNFDKDKNGFTFDDAVHGPRLIGTYKLYKGFYARLSAEATRTNIRFTNSDVLRSDWVKGAFVGIGNAYNFVRGVKGNVQVMYNLLYTEQSPYPKKFNVRMGFEFDFKRRAKVSKRKLLRKYR